MEKEHNLTLSSTKSTQISLEAIRNGKAGLDAHRQGLLNRVPKSSDWAKFDRNSIDLKDLAPIPSQDDRVALRKIGQNKSTVISARTGILIEFGSTDLKFEEVNRMLTYEQARFL